MTMDPKAIPESSTSPIPTVPKPKEIKKANKPFLVHQKWKAAQAVPLAGSPGSSISSADGGIIGMIIWNVLKWTVIGLLSSSLISKVITETWLWEYDGKWSKPGVVSRYSY